MPKKIDRRTLPQAETIQYRCDACGTYVRKRINKKWLRNYCLTKKMFSKLVRIQNKVKTEDI